MVQTGVLIEPRYLLSEEKEQTCNLTQLDDKVCCILITHFLQETFVSLASLPIAYGAI